MPATDELMQSKEVKMIIATGGPGMVKASYSAGKPALGVGAGNSPAYIERTANVQQAVTNIIASKTFDYGTICASEQSVVCDKDMEDAVRAEMEKQGAYFLTDEQIAKLGKFILRANGTMNPMIVGKSAQVIADLAGIDIPAGTKVLVAKETGIGRGHPYSNEKLAPILAFYTADDYKEICRLVQDILHYEGAGHTFSMHTKDPEMVNYFAMRVPASRIIVNTPSALGGIGASTALMPALTLGCGAIGGSATSENVGPMNLLNLKHVAYGLREMEEIRGAAAKEQNCCGAEKKVSADKVDEIVAEIIARIQSAK